MTISLTPEQEYFIQTKLETGKYNSAQEIIDIALRLLDECDRASADKESVRAEAKWIEEVREKIDAAISASNHTPPVDGEAFVNQILERFRQAHQA